MMRPLFRVLLGINILTALISVTHLGDPAVAGAARNGLAMSLPLIVVCCLALRQFRRRPR